MKKAVLFCLILAGCTTEEAPEKKEVRVPVTVAQAKTEDVPIYLETVGTVYGNASVQLKPQVQGQIIATHVMEGQYVKQGDLLYSIGPAILQAEVDKAAAILEKDKAQAHFAKQKLERYSQLKEKEFVSPLTLEELESNLKALEAQVIGDQADLELAKINRSYCDVLSPIDGRISQFDVGVGNLVRAYDERTLTEILQINPVEVHFAFPQKDFQEIKKYYRKGALTFFARDPTGQEPEKEGRVDFMDNKIDIKTGTILLKGVVENRKEIFWPGAFVRVRVFLKTEKNAVVIPSQSVAIGQKGPYVFIVDNEHIAHLKSVSPGVVFEGKTVIDQGVSAGEMVVTDGQINLKNEDKVLLKEGNG